MKSLNSFHAAGQLRAGGHEYEIFRLAALEEAGIATLSRIPYSIKILLENLLRFEDGSAVGFASNDKSWFPVRGTFEVMSTSDRRTEVLHSSPRTKSSPHATS